MNFQSVWVAVIKLGRLQSFEDSSDLISISAPEVISLDPLGSYSDMWWVYIEELYQIYDSLW